MVIGMALMSGYRFDLERRLLAGSAAIGVFPHATVGVDQAERVIGALAELEGVEEVARVVYGQGSVTSETFRDGLDATFRGVDAGGAGLGGRPVRLVRDSGGLPPIALGHEMADLLDVDVDDTVRVTLLQLALLRPKFRYRSFRVSEVFRSGYFEFDRSWAVVERSELEPLVGLSGSWELILGNPGDAARIAEEARLGLGADFEVRNFRDVNRDLFDALEMQQFALFLVLGLIVVVSTFNVASTLVVLVRERLRQLGVLAAMGASPRQLARIFVIYGAFVGFAGVMLGLLAGSGIAWALDEFELIRLDSGLASIYFLSSVPFRLRWIDLGAIAGFAFLVTWFACIVPARRVMRLDPSKALRYE